MFLDSETIFFDFSDLRNSRKIAQLICVNRKNKKIQRSDELNKILKPLYNDSYKNKFLARVYQAIRIEVNNEINALKKIKQEHPTSEENQKTKQKISKAVAPLFISNPFKAKASSKKDSIWQTHPPLNKRIEVLERM